MSCEEGSACTKRKSAHHVETWEGTELKKFVRSDMRRRKGLINHSTCEKTFQDAN